MSVIPVIRLSKLRTVCQRRNLPAILWRSGAIRIVHERLNVPLDIQRIGGELADISGGFGSALNLSATGAVLVRPDGFVAWRAQAVAAEGEHDIERALAHVLTRA